MANIGDVFTIPLGDGYAAVGQVVSRSRVGLALILVSSEILAESSAPTVEKLRELTRQEPAILANSFDSFVDEGTWKMLANFPPPLESLRIPAFKVAGLPFLVESYDGKRKRLIRR